MPNKTIIKTKDWSSYTIEDFVNEHKKHPEWQGLSTKQITKVPGGYAFYGALSRYARRVSKGDIEKHHKIIQVIFKPKQKNWKGYTKINDFVNEFNHHPEWEGKSTDFIQKDRANGGLSFYLAVKAFAIKESKGDGSIQREIMTKVFKPMHQNWLNFHSLKDFAEEYSRHPEWQGKSTYWLQADKKTGGSAFYGALREYAVNTSDRDEKARRNIMRSVIPEQKAFYRYKFSDYLYFDSGPERIVALVLAKLGLVKDYEEGVNLHILTGNRSWRDSIDFLIDKTFIEFHPLSISDIRNGLSLEEVAQKKKKNITKEVYKNYDFYLITNIEELYPLIKKSKFRKLINKRVQTLTKEGFEKIVDSCYRDAFEFDLNDLKYEPKFGRWATFKRLEDFIDEYKKHPEWQGKTTNQIVKEKESGGYAFYAAFLIFANRASNENKLKKKEIIESIFKPEFRQLPAKYNNVEEFKKEYESHPEWCGKSATEMDKDRKSGAHSFYYSLLYFSKKKYPKDKARRRETIKQVLPQKRKDWVIFKNINDYKFEYKNHPEWHKLTIRQLQKDKNGGSAFYSSLFYFLRRNYTDTNKRRAILKEFFNEKNAKKITKG